MSFPVVLEPWCDLEAGDLGFPGVMTPVASDLDCCDPVLDLELCDPELCDLELCDPDTNGQ